MEFLKLNNLTYHYQCQFGQTPGACFSLGPISLSFKKGELLCVVGPSGSGKTTLLRLLAGLEWPSEGEIVLDQKIVSSKKVSIEPEDRCVGLLFQEHALFPHMTVQENICFGLDKWSKEDKQKRLDELVSLLGLKGYENRLPHSLSGGQQQRVALARTLAPKPCVILLDEPLSSIDVELRSQLAHDLRAILKKEQITAVWVTHDQSEAFDLADRIVVLRSGRIEQIDSPTKMYHNPKRRFVADFIGEAAFLPGRLNGGDMIETELGKFKCPDNAIEGKKTEIMVRPENVNLLESEDGVGTISARKFQGFRYLYTVSLTSGQKLFSYQPSTVTWNVGTKVKVMIDSKDVIVFRSRQ